MTDDQTPLLDARSLLCPLPVLKARKVMKTMKTGDKIVVLTDDPAAIIDIPHFCSEAGHTLVSQDQDGDAMRWVLQKG